MDEKRLAEIKDRTDKATKGSWFSDSDKWSGNENLQYWTNSEELLGDGLCASVSKADSEFIANARQDIPDLVWEVERLRKALEDCLHYSESPRMISEVVWEALNWQS